MSKAAEDIIRKMKKTIKKVFVRGKIRKRDAARKSSACA
jgi:hypothetical protein